MIDYRAGLDLGQVADFSALVIAERAGAGRDAQYAVRHIQRWRGSSYEVVVAQVAQVLGQAAAYGRVTLDIDMTGVGRGVFDMFRRAYSEGLLVCSPRAITITAGEMPSDQDLGQRVPKKDLVTRVEILVQGGRLQVAADLPLADALRDELLNFRAKISASGQARFEAAGAGHDDLVLALCLACWEGNRQGQAFRDAWRAMADQAAPPPLAELRA